MSDKISLCHIIFAAATANGTRPAEQTFVEPIDTTIDSEGLYVTTMTKPRAPDDQPKEVIYFYPMAELARVKVVSA